MTLVSDTVAVGVGSARRRQGRKGSALVGVLVVTDDEWHAARTIYPSAKRISSTPYWAADGQTTSVVLRKLPDRGNLPAQLTTRELLEDYSPSFVFLFGTAGGVSRDGVKLGDIVIADYIEYAAFKKIISAEPSKVRRLFWWSKPKSTTTYRYRTLPVDHPSLYLRDDLSVARREAGSSWRTTILAPRPNGLELRVHCGQLLCSDAIFSAPDAEEQRAALDRFDKALAVETEAEGVASAVFSARKDPHYNPLYMIVRGVSDMIEGGHAEKERKAWSAFAAEAAGRLVADVVDELLQIHGAT